MSSISLLETGIVIRARNGEGAQVLLYQHVNEVVSEIVPFDETQARLAIMAFGRFGKGMGHRAQLNFGDCAVYALAGMRVSLCWQRNDFGATDLPVYQA